MSTSNLTVTQLKALVALAETGSFTLASERLGVTQPAVSHTIRQVEELLQRTLFERQRDRTVPNAAGQLAIAEARLALIHMERLEYAVKGEAALQSGTLRLGCFASAVHWILPAAIAEFSRRYPAISVQVIESADESSPAAIAERRVDLGMVNLPCPSLWTMQIFEDDLCIAASSALGASSELAHYRYAPFIHPRGALEPLIEAAFVSAGFKPHLMTSVVAHGPALTLALVKARGGYTLMPKSALAGQDLSNIVSAPIEPRIVRHVAFAAPSQDTISPAARAFLEIIQQDELPVPDISSVNS